MSLSSAPDHTLASFVRDHFVVPVLRFYFATIGTKNCVTSHHDFFLTAYEPLTLANAHPLMFDMIKTDFMFREEAFPYLVSGVFLRAKNKLDSRQFVFRQDALFSLGLPAVQPKTTEPCLIHPRPLALFVAGHCLTPWVKVFPRAHLVRERRFGQDFSSLINPLLKKSF